MLELARIITRMPLTFQDARRPLRLSGTALLWMSFQTLGIIYSDIGTSPLYVLNGIWGYEAPAPPPEDVIGGISAIIWSLTLVPLIKYVLIVLQFGTKEGEGGTFALYHGLFPPASTTDDEDRALTGESAMMRSKSSSNMSTEERLSGTRWLLMAWTLFGTGLVLSDGMLTPAVSVTSAVGGIGVTRPEVMKSIAPISIGFLVVLFGAQRFGTHRLAFAFAPITFVWLLLLGVTGIINIISYPAIFRAFDPSRAIMMFVRTRNYDYLAGILLAVTGCEALFANLGQFNKLSIQLTFATFVYPMLVLAYLGQGAKLITDGDNVITNVFYSTIPGGAGGPLYWIVYVFAILASECFLIASQAMITASFSLVQQVINMKSLPPLRMKYTSETVQGQVYIPTVNWILAIATVVMVAAFKDLAALTNAYGFAVSTVMFITTTLVAVQFHYVKRQPWILAILFLVVFGFIDCLYWGASLRKVPHGAWVTLMVGGVLAGIMLFWTWAKGLEDRFDGANRKNLGRFIVVDELPRIPSISVSTKADLIARPITTDISSMGVTSLTFRSADDTIIEDAVSHHRAEYGMYLVSDDDASSTGEKGERKELARLPTCAVFHKLSSGRGVPHTFYGFLRQWPALPRVVIFLSVRIVNVPRVDVYERYNVSRVRTLRGFYGVTYSLGFRDKFKVDVDDIIQRICTLEVRAGDNGDTSRTEQAISEIRRAAGQSTHIVPHYHVVSKGASAAVMRSIRKFLIEEIYRPFAGMFPETANWLGSADEIIHVGINAAI